MPVYHDLRDFWVSVEEGLLQHLQERVGQCNQVEAGDVKAYVLVGLGESIAAVGGHDCGCSIGFKDNENFERGGEAKWK